MATRRPDVDRVALDRCELRLEEYLETVLWTTPARTLTLDSHPRAGRWVDITGPVVGALRIRNPPRAGG